MKALVDLKMPINIRIALMKYGIETISCPEWDGLDAPVSSHPDMLLYPLEKGRVLIGKEYYEKNKAFFDALPLKYVLCDKTPTGEYPFDVLFDALGVNDTLYGKEGYVSKELTAAYTRFVPVKQGYARCSVAMLSDDCAVTADKGIASALKNDGVDVLVIKEGHIRLDGYNTGFIGGSGGRLPSGEYIFFGDVLSHPDGDKILDFANNHKIKTVSLSGIPLSDHGGFIII